MFFFNSAAYSKTVYCQPGRFKRGGGELRLIHKDWAEHLEFCFEENFKNVFKKKQQMVLAHVLIIL